MPRAVLDTDIFSYVIKGDSRAAEYEKYLDQPCLSFITVAELYRWTLVKNWGASKKQSLETSIQECEILSYDNETAWHWAHVMSIPGKTLSGADGWIAACAIRHDLPLITHNRKHFTGIPNLTLLG